MADCNFQFVKSLAYTEDSILIYNLFVYKISAEATEDDCRQYLTRFGQIVKFRFNIKHIGEQRKVSRHAFVNYKKPENAASVLKRRNHTISPGKSFYVKACDSWHQPKWPSNSLNDLLTVKKKSKAGAKTSNTTESRLNAATGLNLVDLNEDCLLAILKYLPLRDKVSLARSHVNFESAFKLYAKFYCKSICSDDFQNMSLWNIREMFLLVGEFFENFTFVDWFQNKHKERITSFVQYNCPNLRKIKMDTSKIRVASLHKTLSNKLQLTHMTLNCLTVNDHCIHAMKKTPTLEHLAIVNCYGFTGRFLYLLPQLKFLCLSNCSRLQTTNLLRALSVMPNLIGLDVTGVERLHKSVFDALPEKNKNLEILRMSCIHDYFDNIANLPKLRCFGLFCDSYVGSLRSSTFKVLADYCSDKLESLQIVSRQKLNFNHCEQIAKLSLLKKLHVPCNTGIDSNSLAMFGDLKNLVEIKLNGLAKLTNKSLLELIQNCQMLKWINVQNTPIDIEFAKSLLPIVKKEKRKNGRLIILVSGTKLELQICDVASEYETAEIKALVEFVFDYEKCLKTYDNLYDEFEKDCNVLGELPFFDSDSFCSDSDDELDDFDDYDDDEDDDDDFDDFHEELRFHFDAINVEDLFSDEPLQNNFGFNDHFDVDLGGNDIFLW